MSDAKKYTGRLSGQRVLVIGGSSGIGFGVAEGALEHGAEVIISSSSAERVQKSISRLEAAYPSAQGKVKGYVCNTKSADASTEVATLFEKVGGPLDHVVYTAGDPLAIRPLGEWTLQEMQQAGMVRFFGPVLVAQQLKKYLKDAPTSSFTLTSGAITERPRPDWTLVNGFMTGVYGLSRNLALELAPIRVNVVTPGAVDTELWDSLRAAGNFEAMKEGFKTAGTTGKIGEVADVVHAYLYFMQDRNVTGAVVNSSGGVLLK